MMTSAQVVETSVNVISNSPPQDYTHPDDHNLPNYDMTPGFKPVQKIKSESRRESCPCPSNSGRTLPTLSYRENGGELTLSH